MPSRYWILCTVDLVDSGKCSFFKNYDERSFFIKKLVTNPLNKSLKTRILAHNFIYKSYFYNKRNSLCAVIQMKNHVKKTSIPLLYSNEYVMWFTLNVKYFVCSCVNNINPFIQSLTITIQVSMIWGFSLKAFLYIVVMFQAYFHSTDKNSASILLPPEH